MAQRRFEESPNLFGDVLLSWGSFAWGFQSFASVLLVAFLVAGLILAVFRFPEILGSRTENVPPTDATEADQMPRGAVIFGMLLVMGLFGALVGYHGGNSRDGVVGDLMPAVVALIAAIAAYVFGVSDRQAGPMLFPLLASFVATLFITYSMGAVNRSGNQQKAEWEAECFRIFGDPELLSSAEAMRQARRLFAGKCARTVRAPLGGWIPLPPPED